jgi:predicted Zn-dependent peptidase
MSKVHTLSNGLRVFVDPMPSLESVAIGVWACAGSADEREDEHGIAHLLEHMAFKGTTKRSARDIAEEIEAVGGYLNAATSHQRTGYYVRLLKDDIPLGLDILSDILLNPLFDEGELTREKEVVIQEIGEAADMPDDVAFESLQTLSWGDHPLARPILGTPDTVRAHDSDALRTFMRRGYQPTEMVVAAAGKIDVDAFIERAETAFGALKERDNKNARTRPSFVGGKLADSRNIEQTHLAVSFPGVSSRDQDFFAARMFAEVLGGGMSSRLFQRVREEQGLAYSVYAFSDSYDDCGLVGCYAGADADEIPAIAAAFREEIQDLVDNTGAEELARAKSMLRASMLMSLESPAARIESAAGQLFRDNRIWTAEDITARLEAVSAEDIGRCAARALSGPAAVSMVGPGDIEKAAESLAIL